jgi:hypothetical protein
MSTLPLTDDQLSLSMLDYVNNLMETMFGMEKRNIPALPLGDGTCADQDDEVAE